MNARKLAGLWPQLGFRQPPMGFRQQGAPEAYEQPQRGQVSGKGRKSSTTKYDVR